MLIWWTFSWIVVVSTNTLTGHQPNGQLNIKTKVFLRVVVFKINAIQMISNKFIKMDVIRIFYSFSVIILMLLLWDWFLSLDFRLIRTLIAILINDNFYHLVDWSFSGTLFSPKREQVFIRKHKLKSILKVIFFYNNISCTNLMTQ